MTTDGSPGGGPPWETAGVFLDRLAPADRDAVLAAGTRRRYEARSVLFHEGDQPTHALVILSGRLRLSRVGVDGSEMIIELRRSGDLVGELGPFDNEPRNATAIAIEELEVVVIPAERFRDLLAQRGSIAVVVLGTVAEKLRQATDRRLASSTTSTLPRLCRRLVELAEEESPGAEGAIDIASPFTQQELAEWVGVSRDAIVLAFKDLRERRLVDTGRRSIRILDLDGLRALADGAP